MSEKSVQKRNYIIEKAREVFSQKGYLTVTMKDIVEACEISRGGLYLYFDSIKALFLAVLEKEKEESDDELEPALSKATSSADILALFLQEQKKEILKRTGSLKRANYEFYFGNEIPRKENPMRKQFVMSVKIVEKLIKDAVEEGDFVCEDPLGAARNMMYVLEGLKVSAETIGITEETVNREIYYWLKGLAYD
ncbi:TetR/AcrR family transcriptional regulator [Kineothrix sp. MSJ-39]|uniref:TetR/AcrR family transcriptional regulator n=1 Tax=Kineothrix sp. MSJ-39 TaxID=2841533 RepID=UPI001C10F3ED|nr:TetR/AcrR family transcriptional regulator [Kineothrix sp. MSJ-39]MBU5428773.1 TetR/AcrR family transcriptional regulator [Kineothrix sp. MSJ-39]